MFYLVFALKIPLYPGSSLISSEQSPRTERLSPGLESSENPLNKAQFSPFRLCVFFSQHLGGPIPSQSPYKREAVGITVRGKMLNCRLAGGGGTTSQTKAGKIKKKKKKGFSLQSLERTIPKDTFQSFGLQWVKEQISMALSH